jgi:predicted pyridoxine 5'-phosphate oxidase superfamily flavin-nucleotide-binding protein
LVGVQASLPQSIPHPLKGDVAGFVKVLDDHTLAIPDRLGNRRLDTFHNVLRNPNVGIIFLIPGVNGKAPNHVLVVGVENVSHTARGA